MQTSPNDTRKRGQLLSGWLIINVLLNFVIAYLFASTLLTSTQTAESPIRSEDVWAGFVLAITAVINIAALLAIWRWRKIGFYLFAATSIPAFIAYLVMDIRILTAIFPLTSAALTWGLVKPKWHFFY